MSITGPVRMFPDHETAGESLIGQGWTKGFPCRRVASFGVRVLALTCLCLFLAHAPALAQEETPEDKGLRIAREASARDDGFGDFTAGMTMVLRDRHGRESVRQMRFKVLEVAGDGDKSLFVFDQPRDVRGTALLTHAHIKGQDDQWLYLPALKRVKRINAARRSGSFMGSEFSYEDMSAQEVGGIHLQGIFATSLGGGLTCTVTELTPLDKKYGYSRKVVWQDTGELRTWKMELYDRRGAHLKTLTLASYRQYLDRYWRAGEQTMLNHLTGASTVLKWTDFRFRTNLDDSEIHPLVTSTRALMRFRGAIAAIVLMVAAGAQAETLEFSGDLSLQGRWYPQSPALPDQRSGTAGLVVKPTLYGEVAQKTSITLTGLYRYDSADSQRTHADLREAYLLVYGTRGGNSWELRLGLDQAFWGVAEAHNLVDIVNQVDLVEHPRNRPKLGQPMARLTVSGDWGVAESFLLPYHRKRTFPGVPGAIERAARSTTMRCTRAVMRSGTWISRSATARPWARLTSA